MKLLTLVLTLMLTGVFGYTQQQVVGPEKTAQEQEVSSTVDQQDQKKEIQKEELPEQVVAEFDKSVYKEWTIDKVFMIEGNTETSYELHLTLQNEEMVLIADNEGNFEPKAES